MLQQTDMHDAHGLLDCGAKCKYPPGGTSLTSGQRQPDLSLNTLTTNRGSAQAGDDPLSEKDRIAKPLGFLGNFAASFIGGLHIGWIQAERGYVPRHTRSRKQPQQPHHTI